MNEGNVLQFLIGGVSLANFFAIISLVWIASSKMTTLDEARKNNGAAITELRADIRELRQDVKTLIKGKADVE